jgi:hypothetical protein
VMDEGPEVAAHATHVRRRDGEDCVGTDRGVNRAPAAAQKVDTRGGCEMVDGRDHAVGRMAGHRGSEHAESLSLDRRYVR